MRLNRLFMAAVSCWAVLPVWAAGLQLTDITTQVESALRVLETDLSAGGAGDVRAEVGVASVSARLPAGAVVARARRPAGSLDGRSRVWVDVSVDGHPRATVLVPVRFTVIGERRVVRRGDAVRVAIRVGSVEVITPGTLVGEWRPGETAMVRTTSSSLARPARFEKGLFVLEEGTNP